MPCTESPLLADASIALRSLEHLKFFLNKDATTAASVLRLDEGVYWNTTPSTVSIPNLVKKENSLAKLEKVQTWLHTAEGFLFAAKNNLAGYVSNCMAVIPALKLEIVTALVTLLDCIGDSTASSASVLMVAEKLWECASPGQKRNVLSVLEESSSAEKLARAHACLYRFCLAQAVLIEPSVFNPIKNLANNDYVAALKISQEEGFLEFLRKELPYEAVEGVNTSRWTTGEGTGLLTAEVVALLSDYEAIGLTPLEVLRRINECSWQSGLVPKIDSLAVDLLKKCSTLFDFEIACELCRLMLRKESVKKDIKKAASALSRYVPDSELMNLARVVFTSEVCAERFNRFMWIFGANIGFNTHAKVSALLRMIKEVSAFANIPRALVEIDSPLVVPSLKFKANNKVHSLGWRDRYVYSTEFCNKEAIAYTYKTLTDLVFCWNTGSWNTYDKLVGEYHLTWFQKLAYMRLVSEAILSEEFSGSTHLEDITDSLVLYLEIAKSLKGIYDAKDYLGNGYLMAGFAANRQGTTIKSLDNSSNMYLENASYSLAGLLDADPFEKGMSWGTYEALCARAKIKPYTTSGYGDVQKSIYNLVRFFKKDVATIEGFARSAKNDPKASLVTCLHDAGLPEYALLKNEKWADFLLKYPTFALKYVSLFNVYEQRHGVATTKKEFQEKVGDLVYEEVPAKHAKLATYMFALNQSEHEFNRAVKYLDKTKPKTDSLLEMFCHEDTGSGWIARLLEKDDFRAPLIGIETGCCQHVLGGFAASCAAASYTHPAYGVMVVESKNATVHDMAHAQSLIWRTTLKSGAPAIVIDSIEGRRSDDISVSRVTLLYQKTIDTWLSQGYEVFISGTNYGLTAQVSKKLAKIYTKKPERRPPIPARVYTDCGSSVYRLTAKPA